jgi:hypothetical protein
MMDEDRTFFQLPIVFMLGNGQTRKIKMIEMNQHCSKYLVELQVEGGGARVWIREERDTNAGEEVMRKPRIEQHRGSGTGIKRKKKKVELERQKWKEKKVLSRGPVK